MSHYGVDDNGMEEKNYNLCFLQLLDGREFLRMDIHRASANFFHLLN